MVTFHTQMDIETSNLHAIFMQPSCHPQSKYVYQELDFYEISIYENKYNTLLYHKWTLARDFSNISPPPTRPHLTFSMGVISKRSILVTSSSWTRSATSEVFTTDIGSSPINVCNFYMYITYNVYEQSNHPKKQKLT